MVFEASGSPYTVIAKHFAGSSPSFDLTVVLARKQASIMGSPEAHASRNTGNQ